MMNPKSDPLSQQLMNRAAPQAPSQEPVGPPPPPSPPLLPHMSIQELLDHMAHKQNPLSAMLGGGADHKIKMTDPSGGSQEISSSIAPAPAVAQELPTTPPWVRDLLGANGVQGGPQGAPGMPGMPPGLGQGGLPPSGPPPGMPPF